MGQAGIGTVNWELDISVPWTVLPAPALYDDDDAGESEELLRQGPWYERRAPERGDIVEKYVSDGWLSSGICLKWTDTCCWWMKFAFYDEDLVIHQDYSRLQARAEFASQESNIQRMPLLVSSTIFDMLFFRTHSEMDYLAALNSISCSAF